MDWQVPQTVQPRPEDYGFDLDRALASVVSVRTRVADDAFTADILGTERSGNGVLIRPDGLVLTIGYLVTEAETIWLGLSDGRTVPGDVIGFDQQTGFGLVRALARLSVPSLPLGDSSIAGFGDHVIVAGAGGRQRSVAAQIVARQEFAGYWEYVLDEALFTAPAHPFWGGTGLIGGDGRLLGIGSLRLDQASSTSGGQINMMVPVDLLKPILDDLLATGSRRGPARPWLGLYAVEGEEGIVVAGVARKGPAERSGLRTSDAVLAVGGEEIDGLADFFRKIWALGPAGVAVPVTVRRDDEVLDMTVASADRNDFLKSPRLH
jgi:S1-C subfamily serine protease